jgi:hypothetical protein
MFTGFAARGAGRFPLANGALVALAALLVMVYPRSASAREVIQASVVALEPIPGPQTGFMTIHLDAITEEAALAADIATFERAGQDGLLKRWHDEDTVVGRLIFPEELGLDLRIARQENTTNGRRLILITDRPITWGEVRRNDRSRDYPVTWIELELDRKGGGTGRMIPVARLKLEAGQFAFDNFNIQPVRLTNLKVTRQ